MQSALPNPQTATVNLTKELRKLLRDPLLRKPPSPLPHLNFLIYNTRGLAGPKPNLILNLASFLHIDLLILTETHTTTPPFLFPKGIWATRPDSTAGVAVIPVSPKIRLHPISQQTHKATLSTAQS